MEQVVIGITDDQPGSTAIEWAIERVRSRPIHFRLVCAVDVSASSLDPLKTLLAETAHRIQLVAPETQVDTALIDRPLLHELLDRSEAADLLVIGSHPDPGIREGRTPSFPVSLAARSQCPVVVVPDDWQPRGGPIVVGVDAVDGWREAGVFAAQEAAAAGRDLVIVHTWEPWGLQNTRATQFEHESMLEGIVAQARAQFPSVSVQGVLHEAVAHEGVIASSQNASLIVLGTHRLGRESGLVLGAIHQEIMIRGGTPLCIVPLADTADDLRPLG